MVIKRQLGHKGTERRKIECDRAFLRKICNCTIPLPPHPSLTLLFPPLPFYRGSGGITRGKILEIRDARRWVLEHFGVDIKINTVMNKVFKWCLLFRDLCLILTMFSGCCVWIPHYNGAWLAVCDTVTVLLCDLVLLAFEKILVLFSGHEKLHFYNCTNFCLQLHNFFTTAQSVAH